MASLDMDLLAVRLRQTRDALAFSPTALAHRAGIPWRTLDALEHGRLKHVRAATILALAGVLGVSTDYLLGFPNPPVPAPADAVPVAWTTAERLQTIYTILARCIHLLPRHGRNEAVRRDLCAALWVSIAVAPWLRGHDTLLHTALDLADQAWPSASGGIDSEEP